MVLFFIVQQFTLHVFFYKNCLLENWKDPLLLVQVKLLLDGYCGWAGLTGLSFVCSDMQRCALLTNTSEEVKRRRQERLAKIFEEVCTCRKLKGEGQRGLHVGCGFSMFVAYICHMWVVVFSCL